ncbi:hypothetical protein [Nocardioides terrisoli]|uniref:hypothetical protein n=1 Tax=Nocardioides terrisoli TaxID=3388267 RepID=UPI00287B950D|nr:hypothetical protein [Nocardioides marmorisolisilvae]
MTDMTNQRPEYGDPPRRGTKVTHLVIGLIYLGIVASWALGQGGVIGWGDSAYVFPAVLVGAGLLGLVASLAGRGSRRAPAPAPVDAPAPEPDAPAHPTAGPAATAATASTASTPDTQDTQDTQDTEEIR